MMPYAPSWFTLPAAVTRAATDTWLRCATTLLALPTPATRESASFGAPAEKVDGKPEDVEPGFEVAFTREVTDDLIRAFAHVSGDENPLHLDDAYASRTQFGGRIAHGVLSVAFVSAALSRFPGVVVYLSQDLKFTKPVAPGDRVTATVRVVEKPEGKKWLRLATTCTLEDGTSVLEGEAKILLLPEE